MCCPALKHLNLSGCQSLTDCAFAFPSSTSSSSKCYSDTFQPGCHLTSVDISGCHSITTKAIKYLVTICGPTLKHINLACTGVDSIALLHLAGLNMDHLARLVSDRDYVSFDLLEFPEDAKHLFNNHSSLPCYSMHKANQTARDQDEEQSLAAEDTVNICDSSRSEITQEVFPDSNIDLIPQTCVSLSNDVVNDNSLFTDLCDHDDEMEQTVELRMLKDSLCVISKSIQKEDLCNCAGFSDDESDDSFKTADETPPCSFLLEEEESLQVLGQTHSEMEKTPESQESCCEGKHDISVQLINSGEANKLSCCNLTTENKTKQKSDEETYPSDNAVPLEGHGGEDPGCSGLESVDHKRTNVADFATQEIFEEYYDTLSHLEGACAEEKNLNEVIPAQESVSRPFSNEKQDMTSMTSMESTETGMLTNTMPHKGVTDEELNCLSSKEQADLVIEIQTYQPQITSLDITNISYQSKQLGMACLKIFARACNRLKHFSISGNVFDDEDLGYILKNEPELESLTLVSFFLELLLYFKWLPISWNRWLICGEHTFMPLTRFM